MLPFGAHYQRGATATSVTKSMANDDDINTTELACFFQFLQCQLRMEARCCFNQEVQLQDPAAEKLWDKYIAFVPNSQGAREKWMPYHTVLGSHELFIVEHIRFPDPYRQFLAMFIFRAHCKHEMFDEVQRPLLDRESFWKDPIKHFETGGEIYQRMLEYRRGPGKPALQTGAFRMIPDRLTHDNDENLVQNICNRTQTLLRVADEVWPIVHDNQPNKFTRISDKIQKADGLGDTWSKMLMVSIDIMYPDLCLVSSQCDVGIGAQPALQRILRDSQQDAKVGLERLRVAMNESKLASAAYFRKVLPQVERLAGERFKKDHHIMRHLRTGWTKEVFTASTVQVQLCEWRQFMERTSEAHKRPAELPVDSLRALSKGHNGHADTSSSTSSSPSPLPPGERHRILRRAEAVLEVRQAKLHARETETLDKEADAHKAVQQAFSREEEARHVKRKYALELRDVEVEWLEAEAKLKPLQRQADRLQRSRKYLFNIVEQLRLRCEEQLLGCVEWEEPELRGALDGLLPQLSINVAEEGEEPSCTSTGRVSLAYRRGLRELQDELALEEERAQHSRNAVAKERAKVDAISQRCCKAHERLRSAEEDHREAVRARKAACGKQQELEGEVDTLKWDLKLSAVQRTLLEECAASAAPEDATAKSE